MDKIIESFLNTHTHEYELNPEKKEVNCEHFINRCIINKYLSERFDPEAIMTEQGEKGLDGVAIIVNERLILDSEHLDSIIKEKEILNVKFLFIQAKTGEKFSGSEIGDFIYGVKAFFASEAERPSTNIKMESLIKIKDEIYKNSVYFAEAPTVDLYYACCGNWDENNGLRTRIDLDLKPLRDSVDFKCIDFFPYDSEKIIITYKELKKKVVKTFQMEKRMTFPAIDGVKQAFMGIVKCKDFVSLLTDSDSKMLTNIFEDNVRDFQGYNNVNSEIQQTINQNDDQNRFAILNNGITIVSKSIKVTGDNISLFDYQIVNGCQTSYVLFDSKDKLTEDSYIILKLIEVTDEKISDRVIFTTNRQTEVKSEAFTATKPFHKKLEDFYYSIEPTYRLFYERRSKQFDLKDDISKQRIVTLATQISAYIAVFLNEPHSTHRYYGELLGAYKNKLFLENDSPDVYYISSYLLNRVDEYLKNNGLSREYKRFRYHIACAIKTLEVGDQVIFGQARKQRKEFEKLFELIKDTTKLENHIKSAISCLKETILLCDSVHFTDRHRSKDITKELLTKIICLSTTQNNTNFLKVGETVHCVVTSMNSSFVYVKLKTEDSRNYGSIHISNLTGEYISELSSEVSVSDTFQARIIKDFYESEYGWELSKI